MKKEDLEKISTEELLKRQKTIKVISGVMVGLLLVLLVAAISTSKEPARATPLIVIVLALSAVLLPNYTNLQVIKSELKRHS